MGSKAWLLSNALDGGGEREAGQTNGIAGVASGKREAREAAGAAVGVEGSNDSLPEDRFHLRLPKG